jgi:hypothetical protein
MKKRAWLFCAAGMLALALPVAAQSVTVVVNGQTMNFTQPPIERAGRVFVPLRGIFEQLGASVVYANGQINATAHGRTVSLNIGSTQATVAGQPATLTSHRSSWIRRRSYRCASFRRRSARRSTGTIKRAR